MKEKNRPVRNLLSGLLLIELEDFRWSRGLEKWLADLQPAGVVLVGSRLPTPEATRDFLTRVARTATAPPILALRENGGSRSPLRRYFPQIPSPREVARKGPRAAQKLGELIGAALKLIGFNLTLAPSLDLSAPYSDLLLDNHIFSADPEIVTRCGGAFIKGLRKSGILAAPGHFPGLSDAKDDRSSPIPVAENPMAEMWIQDLVPYRRLLGRSPFVVVSHIAYKAFDLNSRQPAFMSESVLKGLLREKLGYKGVTVADIGYSIKLMADASSAISTRGFTTTLELDAYAKSIAAGIDLHVISSNPVRLQLVLKDLRHAVESGAIPSWRIEESIRRIRRARKGLRIPAGSVNSSESGMLTRELARLAR